MIENEYSKIQNNTSRQNIFSRKYTKLVLLKIPYTNFDKNKRQCNIAYFNISLLIENKNRYMLS